jgi:argininosuccinate lyase
MAEERGIPLDSLRREDLARIDEMFEIDLDRILDSHAALEKRTAMGGTAQSALSKQIQAAQKALGDSSRE